MPTYDYRCEACNKSFSLAMSMKEHDEKKIKCPKCSSVRVKQKVSSFFAITSHKG